MMGVVLVPGLLAAGVGSLIYVGLNSLTGFGTFALAIPDLPTVGSPTIAQFVWAIVIGLLAATTGAAITRLALELQAVIERRMLVLMPLVGVAIGAIVLVFVETTDKTSAEVLYSGQDQLPALITDGASWSAGALIMVVVCKSLAYTLSLSCFRGGPVFPGMFIGAAGGIALSHLPGLPLVPGAAMGIGAMTVAMLGLPMVAALLVALFLQSDGLALMPPVIVAVVVSYVASARLRPAAPASSEPSAPVPATS